MHFLFDNPILRFFSKLTDLVLLNLVTAVCCIPIITIGASITACHYAALRIRKDEGTVIQNFFRSFKENFKQSTGLWLMLVVHVTIAAMAWMVAHQIEGILSGFLFGTITVLLFLTAFVAVWIFPLQSYYINPIKTTINNALILAFKHFFRTLSMIAMHAIPILLLWILPLNWYIAFLLLVGISAPLFWCAMQYGSVFESLEQGE